MSEPALKTKKGPEWKHVVVIDQPVDAQGKNKGDPTVQCIHCKEPFQFRGGATRIRSHLLGGFGIKKCADIPPGAKKALQQLHENKEVEASKKRKLIELDKQLQRSDSDPTALGSLKQSSLTAAFSNASKATADAAVARYFYGTGTPFYHAKSPFFKEMLYQVGL